MTYLITFYSQFDAILANRILISAGVPVRLMPVPRAVSSSCGTCVQFDLDRPPVQSDLPRVEWEDVYRHCGGGWEKIG